MVDCGVKQARDVFEGLVDLAGHFLTKHQYYASSVCAQIAADYACIRHPGLFVSPQLEKLLCTIGAKFIRESAQLPNQHRTAQKLKPTHVLHVLTYAKPIGGDTRFVYRWIQMDGARSHSVVITGLQVDEVPTILSDAVVHTGGKIYRIDRTVTNPIQRAQALRDISNCADLIVLHSYPQDTVPVIAFANKGALPPVVNVTHADQVFWVGVSISDVFAHLREGGCRLAEERRGIERERYAFLPIPLTPSPRILSRSEAKKQIGLPEDSILILSIARAMKYKPISGPSFLDVITPVVEKHKKAVLLVIGPESSEQWEAVKQKTQGRIKALGTMSETRVYYEAADIYVDSFPFSSNTSLLEAAGYGLPLVSYFPFSAQTEVLGAGAPGIDGTLIKVTDDHTYRGMISRLIEDLEFRQQMGESTRRNVLEVHNGYVWDRHLQTLYAKAFSTHSKISSLTMSTNYEHTGELDVLLNRLYPHFSLTGAIEQYVKPLPLWLRFRILSKMLKIDRTFSFSLFLPDWLAVRVNPYMRGWRKFPGVSWWMNRPYKATN